MPTQVNKRLKSYQTRLKTLKEKYSGDALKLVDKRVIKEMTRLEKKVGDMKEMIEIFEDDFCERFPELPDPKKQEAKPGGITPEQITLLVFLVLFVVAAVALVIMLNMNGS